MQIARIETFLVPPRWLFVRIETDDGIIGWGEPVVEGNADTVRTAVEQLGERLIGNDPLRIQDHWQIMTKGGFYRGGPILSSAVAGLDQALWDIMGKTVGLPVHVLLGGPVRDRIRMYGWIGGDEPSEVADAIAKRMDEGLTAVKMNATGRFDRIANNRDIDAIVNRVAAAREVLGDTGDVGVDFHGRVTLPNAKRILPELEPLRPMFVEEPTTPENSHLLHHLTDKTSIPIATGERLFNRNEFLPVFEAGISIAQPDLSHAGGISEVHRIAGLAEIFDVQLAPHCPLGPISLAACLQIGFAVPNYFIQEQSIGIHYNEGGEVLDYVADTSVFDFKSGYIERLTGPGLGIEVDEAAVRSAATRGHTWRSPVWRLADGSHAEW